MGLGDIFKATENKKLKEENERLNSLPPSCSMLKLLRRGLSK